MIWHIKIAELSLLVLQNVCVCAGMFMDDILMPVNLFSYIDDDPITKCPKRPERERERQ